MSAVNPYREGRWDGTSAEVEMDDRWRGWEHGYAGGAVRACRSQAYEQGLAKGRTAQDAGENMTDESYDPHYPEAAFQDDRRKALASGSYEVFQRHVLDYPGVYNFTGPWTGDPEPGGVKKMEKEGK